MNLHPHHAKATFSNNVVDGSLQQKLHNDENDEMISSIVLIDSRTFYRECISASLFCLASSQIVSLESVNKFLECEACSNISLIVIFCTNLSEARALSEKINEIIKHGGGAPIVVVSDVSDEESIISMLRNGIRAYVSTRYSLDIIIEVLRMVSRGGGGVFAPLDAHAEREAPVLDFSPSPPGPALSARGLGISFTNRQIAVLETLRTGLPNKLIAQKLKINEATVKVHVRTIMKKLNARTRTEVAYIMTSQGL